MAVSAGRIWVSVPVIVRAALHAAWAASKIGAVSLAGLFTVGSLAFGIYEVAAGHAKIMELPEVLLGGAAVFVLSLLFSFVVTVPASALAAIFAYPYLRPLRAFDRRVFGVVGFLVGALVWSAIWWNAPAANLYFGSWISLLVVGGPSGCAGGVAFARQLRE